MTFYLRYTDTPTADLERGVSFHHGEGEYNDDFGYCTTKLNGLCVFALDAENLDDAIIECEDFYFSEAYKTDQDSSYVILKGVYSGDCEEGELIKNAIIVHTVKGKYFES